MEVQYANWEYICGVSDAESKPKWMHKYDTLLSLLTMYLMHYIISVNFNRRLFHSQLNTLTKSLWPCVCCVIWLVNCSYNFGIRNTKDKRKDEITAFKYAIHERWVWCNNLEWHTMAFSQYSQICWAWNRHWLKQIFKKICDIQCSSKGPIPSLHDKK